MSTRKARRLPALAALLLAVMLILLPAPKANALAFKFHTFPSGTIGLARPEIGMYLNQTDGQLTASSYTLYLNNKQVEATYNGTSLKFSYTPDKGLAPGPYSARIVLEYPGYQPIVKSWDFTVAQDPIAEFPTVFNEDQRSGLAAINDYRLIYGLPPLAMNPQLAAAAQKHAEYLDKNKIDGSSASLHDEKSSLPGYIGATLDDRLQFIYYTGGYVDEDVSLTYGTVVEAIDKLFDAPYHRIPFLDPMAKELGIAQMGHYTVLEFGKNKSEEPQFVVSPAINDAYVPIRFDGHESPDPIRIHASGAYPVGYPIMAAVTGPNVKQVALLSAKLIDSNGNDVKLLTNAPDADDHLRTEVILIPEKPLAYDSSYTVNVKLTASLNDGGTKPYEQQWAFHTEPSNELGKRKLHAYSADYKRAMTAGSGVKHTASFGLDGSAYILDNVTFPMKVKPYIVNGASYLWVRDLAAALGATVDWDDAAKAAKYMKKGRTVTLYTTKAMYAADGKDQATDSPAKLIGGNTMIPVRLLSEVLGAKIDFDDKTRTVNITYE